MVGAGIQQLPLDLWLRPSPHPLILSRNERYVYRNRQATSNDVEVAMRVVFVHGACVRDGSWWWHRAAESLQARGITSIAPALPSCGEAGPPAGPDGPGLGEDVDAVRQLLQTGSEPTVIVAHSYGGIVVSEAAAGIDSVRQLVLISSYLPDPGQSLSSFGDGTPAPFLDIDAEGGTFGVRADALADTFLQDCSPEIAHDAIDHLARQSLSVIQQPVTASAWRQVPTTYLVCTEDRGTPVAAQREFARRAQTVVEFDAGHHPFLSQPDAVADLIANLA
jgi:pimeloyl-ACP methyl ester carboxylesterase